MDPWGNPYIYYYPGKHNPDSYDLLSAGPDGKEGTDDDIGNWTINDELRMTNDGLVAERRATASMRAAPNRHAHSLRHFTAPSR